MRSAGRRDCETPDPSLLCPVVLFCFSLDRLLHARYCWLKKQDARVFAQTTKMNWPKLDWPKAAITVWPNQVAKTKIGICFFKWRDNTAQQHKHTTTHTTIKGGA